MDMIFCRQCGTRFDSELLSCPVCKAEVIPPEPDKKAPRKAALPAVTVPPLPTPTTTFHIVERPAVEGVLTGAVWSDVIFGLLAGLVLPIVVGWSVFSAMGAMQMSYLLALGMLALPVGLEIALFFNILGRYRPFAIGLGVSAFLCLGGVGICAVLFAGSALMLFGRT